MTKAMPVLDGKFCSNSMAASNPPAEPPTPTIGQPTDFFCAFALPGFVRACPRWWVRCPVAAGVRRRSAPSLPFVLRFGDMVLHREINGSCTSKPGFQCSANPRQCLFQDYYDRPTVAQRRKETTL